MLSKIVENIISVQNFHAWIKNSFRIFIIMIKLIARYIVDWIKYNCFNGAYENRQYSFASPRSQNFSLPLSIIYYITKTPTRPEGYMKLIQTCKYFTSKQHIVPIGYIECMEFGGTDYDPYEEDIPTLGKIYIRNDRSSYRYPKSYGFYCPDLKKLQNLETVEYKIWLHGELLCLRSGNFRFLNQKIYRCDCKILNFSLSVSVKYDEFMFLIASGSVQELTLECPIKRKAGTLLLLEEIFEMVPNIIKLW